MRNFRRMGVECVMKYRSPALPVPCLGPVALSQNKSSRLIVIRNRLTRTNIKDRSTITRDGLRLPIHDRPESVGSNRSVDRGTGDIQRTIGLVCALAKGADPPGDLSILNGLP